MYKVSINREFPWGVKGSDDVLDFIEKFRTHEEGGIADEVLTTQFSCGYCYYFAVMLKAAFNRGEVCWCAPYSHFCWVDDDGTPYDIYGLCDSEAEYFIPYSFLGDCLNDFLHIGKDHNTTEEEIQNIIDNYCKAKGIKEDYGCDICGARKDYDEEIIWITSTYGVCEDCYNKLTNEDKDKIRNDFE